MGGAACAQDVGQATPGSLLPSPTAQSQGPEPGPTSLSGEGLASLPSLGGEGFGSLQAERAALLAAYGLDEEHLQELRAGVVAERARHSENRP